MSNNGIISRLNPQTPFTAAGAQAMRELAASTPVNAVPPDVVQFPEPQEPSVRVSFGFVLDDSGIEFEGHEPAFMHCKHLDGGRISVKIKF